MSFSPKCKDSLPTIIIVDAFVTTGGSGIQSALPPNQVSGAVGPGFKQYPKQVSDAFSKALQDSLNLITFKTAQTAPSKPALPLFQIAHVENIEMANLVLGAGDVIVCFSVFPTNYRISTIDGTFQTPPVGGDLDKVNGALRQKVFDQFVKGWKAVADPKRSPPPTMDKVQGDQPEPDTLGLGGGAATPLDIVLARGKKKTYFASRTALVDAGSIAGVAVDNWFGNTEVAKTRDAARRAVLQRFLSLDSPELACTPAALAKFAGAKLPESDQILANVGRGLGYTVVHEIWHATRGAAKGHVPEDSGLDMFSVIEGAANPSFKRDGLKLLSRSVAEIMTAYENTWCKFITDDRQNVASLR